MQGCKEWGARTDWPAGFQPDTALLLFERGREVACTRLRLPAGNSNGIFGKWKQSEALRPRRDKHILWMIEGVLPEHRLAWKDRAPQDKMAYWREGYVIGTIAKPTKYYTEEGSNLFFQIKNGKDTVDPMLLLRWFFPNIKYPGFPSAPSR